MDDLDRLKSFDEMLARHAIYGQWQSDAYLQGVTDGPKPAGGAHKWAWAEVHALLEEAGQVMPESLTARRSLMFANPHLPRRGTTHTIAMGMQMILPGEVAWAHRHSIAALRFTVKGSESLFTVVDGETCAMEDNDLVLTPGGTWHDHHNDSGEAAVWLDVLDVPLVIALNQTFYQPYGEETQPLRAPAEGMAERIGALRPAWEAAPTARLPLRYPWREVEGRLQRLRDAEGSPFDGVALQYANPVTGGPTLPTLTCWAQWLRPGLETRRHRRTLSAVYHVVRGEGRTVVGDTEIAWGPRDSFCVPNWAWHHHIVRPGAEEAVLFSVHDIPVLAALGLYREEPGPGVAARAARNV